MWEFASQMLGQLSFTHWIVQVFFIVFMTMVANLAIAKIYRRLHGKLSQTKHIWDDTLVEAIYRPVRLLIWVLGITFAAEIVSQYAQHKAIFQVIEPVRTIAVIASLAWAINRFTTGFLNNLVQSKSSRIDQTTGHAIGQLLRLSVLITAGLVMMQSLGYSISTVLAVGGIGGLAVSLAAKDLLANIFGGLMIYLDRPFDVGDWIRSPDRNIEGTVEYIGWRLTRIRTFDKRPLYVPNSIFSLVSVENPSRMTNRRIKETVGIRYADARTLSTITDQIETMLRNHDDIDNSKTIFAKLINFGASSLDIQIYTFTKTTDWVSFQGIQQDVFLRIIDIIERNGAECAFPTRTLEILRNEIPDSRPADNNTLTEALT